MAIDETVVRKVAALSRIAVSDAEVTAMVPELSKLLEWVGLLGEVDTQGIEPMATVIDNTLKLRADVVTDGDKRDAILSNAPANEHGFFGVPKVIE